MSQPNYSNFDFAPKRDSRGPANSSNFPVSNVDHSQEVRALINDLQSAARDARARTTAVEQERDDLAARLAEAKTQLGEFRQQFVEISSMLRERDEAVARAGNAQSHSVELQRHVELLTRERNDAMRIRDENARLAREAAQQLDETQRQLVSVRGARDSAQASNLQVNQLLQECRDEIIHLRDDLESLKHSAEKTSAEAADLRSKLAEQSQTLADSERDALQRQIQEITSERDSLKGAAQDYAAVSEQQGSRVQELVALADVAGQARVAAEALRDELAAKLSTAQAEINRLHSEGGSGQVELQAQLAAMRDQLAESEKRAADAVAQVDATRMQRDTFAEKAGQAESQRLCAIDLAAQLENAKRDLIGLAADLAEARLQNKSNQSKLVRAAQNPPAATGSFSYPKASSAPPLTLPPQPILSPLMASDPAVQEALTEKEARSIHAAIKECHQSFTRDASDLSLINELHCHVHHLSERARTSGFAALHRISSALSLFAQELYRFPEQANSSALRTLEQTIDFLGVLLKQPDYVAIKDPGTARVYAVDDDIDNCDAIRMALETVMLRAKVGQQPAVALSEIAAEQFDLIFLDVNLPHMDGFELCQHIRQMPNYERVPIVFLTGLTTIENRVQSSLSGGNDFIGKPFNLHELSVKALTLVLKASLDMP